MSYDVLNGVRVIEVSLYAFAPSAAAVLADWGADVVKVVPPKVADPMLGNPIAGLPDRDVGVAFMWELLNRGKRCVALDVSVPEGRDALLSLASEADVFLTNLLPGARQRFGLDPSDLQAVNPAIIYARASGHGAEGPEREAGGYDHTDFWARSGIGHAASQVADEFVPQPIPAMGDLTAGASLAGAIAAALFRRERTGQGAVVDVSLLSTAMWVSGPSAMAAELYGVATIPRMRHADQSNAFVGAYATRDSRMVYIAGIQTESGFEEFCELVDRLDLVSDPRFATAAGRYEHRRALIAELDVIFATRDLSEWVPLLTKIKTPWTIIQTAAEAARDPQVIANRYLPVVHGSVDYPVAASPAQFDEVPPTLTRAPQHGEHTELVLLEQGRTWDDIGALKDAGAII